MSEPLRWETDKAGDALYREDDFLGCIYNRDGGHYPRAYGWRALAGEEMIFVGDVLPTREQPDARKGARALLETHMRAYGPLPTARELLEGCL